MNNQSVRRIRTMAFLWLHKLRVNSSACHLQVLEVEQFTAILFKIEWKIFRKIPLRVVLLIENDGAYTRILIPVLWDWAPNLDFIIKVDLTMEPAQINQAWMWWNFCFFVALNHCRFQGKFLPAATFNEKSLKRCGSIKGDKWIYLKDGSGILESLLNWSWFCNFVVDATIYVN